MRGHRKEGQPRGRGDRQTSQRPCAELIVWLVHPVTLLWLGPRASRPLVTTVKAVGEWSGLDRAPSLHAAGGLWVNGQLGHRMPRERPLMVPAVKALAPE